MPLPVIGDTFRCALNWTYKGMTAENVIHVLTTLATPEVIAATLDSAFQANMTDAVSLAARANTVTITPLDGVHGSTEHALANWVGKDLESDVSPAVAQVVRFRTALGGRSRRGRMFLPFISDNSHDDGLFSDAEVTLVNAAFRDFLDFMHLGGVVPCDVVVASYKLVASFIVTDAGAQKVAATQRRRQSRLH